MGSSLKITKWLIQKLFKCRKSKIIDFIEGNLCNMEKEYDVNSTSFVVFINIHVSWENAIAFNTGINNFLKSLW